MVASSLPCSLKNIQHATENSKNQQKNYNFLKDNEEEVKQILKSLGKRKQKDLPVQVAGSSQLAENAPVVVDLSGMRPTVAEGVIAVRDMPIQNRRLQARNRRRAAQRAVPEPQEEEQQQIEADQEHDDEQDQDQDLVEDQVDLEDHVQSPTSPPLPPSTTIQQQPTETPPIQQPTAPQPQLPRPIAQQQIPVKLKEIVDNIYDIIGQEKWVQSFPAIALEEHSFVPLSLQDSEQDHFASFKKLGQLADQTLSASEQSYALRCYNTYLAQWALVEKIMDLEPERTVAQVLYSLKEKYVRLQIGTDVVLGWKKLKRCAVRGKVIYDFMMNLNLGTSGKFVCLHTL